MSTRSHADGAVTGSETDVSASGAPAVGGDVPEPTLRQLVASDLDVWGEVVMSRSPGQAVGPVRALHWIVSYAGLRAVLLYRLAHAAYRARIRLLPLLLANLNLTLHGFDVPPAVPVGRRLYVPHPVGTVVMARGLGENVTLVSGVTIGMRDANQEPRFPLIGNGVYIGAGARVLGGITVGDRVQVGANAVVIRDVPSDSVAVGVPATVRPARPSGNGG
jgi:serine O-acetyltransferase